LARAHHLGGEPGFGDKLLLRHASVLLAVVQILGERPRSYAPVSVNRSGDLRAHIIPERRESHDGGCEPARLRLAAFTTRSKRASSNVERLSVRDRGAILALIR